MNPFPANSVQDTDNEQPLSEPTSTATGHVAADGLTARSISRSPIINGNSNSNSNGTNWNGHYSNGGARYPTQAPALRSRTRFSWPGQRWTDRGVSRQAEKSFCSNGGVETYVMRECYSVALWALTVPFLSLVIVRLLQKSEHLDTWQKQGDSRFLLAVIASLLLKLLPHRLGTAPGFFLSHIWILQRIRETLGSGVYANLGCRFCEWRLGRIPKQALLLSCLVHVVVPFLVWGFLSFCSKELSLYNYRESPLFALKYKSSNDVQDFVYLLKEVLGCALFPVAVMVVPVLLKLNDYPEWLSLLVLYPLYGMGVDSDGRGSSLNPAALIAQSLLFGTLYANRWRLVAQFLGTGLAAAIMLRVFPDDPSF